MRRDFRSEKDHGYALRMRSPVGFRRRSRLTVLVGIVVSLLLFYRVCLPEHHAVMFVPQDMDGTLIPGNSHIHLGSQDSQSWICPELGLASDVLVVLRTGATEALEKLPVHFDTTLRCVPDYVVYSDLEEEIHGHHVYDVLEGVSETLKSSAPEFQLYDHLRIHGREGLKNTTHLGSGPGGALENPSWRLDRFKFLPMVDKAFKRRPNARWFVFMEADTYLVWENLLGYLSLLDPNQAMYIGKHMYIGGILFAHGGSGFVLSAAAMRKVTEQRDAHLAEYDDYTAENWAGDMVLGKVLKDAGVPLYWAYPHFQGDPVSSFDHNVSKIERTPWCYAPITYHHMRNVDIHRFWNFEQTRKQDGKTNLLHGDVFKEYILPQIAARVDNWDNLSMDVEPDEAGPFEKCQLVCEAKADCLQFSYAAGKCSTSTQAILGESANTRCMEYSSAASKCIKWQEGTQFAGSIQSGWIMDRLSQYVADMDSMCSGVEKEKWVV
ncbi:glycosyltransferase family 31 protein [Stemphylium lycopersici]|uniref:N-acetylgalactosaminide beta-1,3-galactosyltransferase n=1 Tax=Stemphylium lycopersici TaxID=183478 RepID=A0A364NB35_STELY|nr:glycosyltransferase family 31 protein [Stemphylium lycopersici]RAR10346.1 glycosyltransferase family 31 protein [Stemphylium lycopersici]RAR14472.1 glycosyltransferase family 31 protein [Stemphylium lycopersici]